MSIGEARRVGAMDSSAMIASDLEAGRMGQRMIAGLAVLVLIITIAVALSVRPATITRTASELSVRSAGFSATVPLASIDSVRLTTSLSGLGAKRGGFQFGNTYAGTFEMKPHGSVRLFVNTSRPPYVMVYAKTGMVVVNAETPARTSELFEALSTVAR